MGDTRGSRQKSRPVKTRLGFVRFRRSQFPVCNQIGFLHGKFHTWVKVFYPDLFTFREIPLWAVKELFNTFFYIFSVAEKMC